MENIAINLLNKKVLIWDWNGTLLNDVDACHRSLCRILLEHDLPEISLAKHREMFRFPIRAFYDELGFDFDKVSYDEVSERYHVFFRQELQSASLFAKANDFLQSSKDRGVTHFILSASHQDDLLYQTKTFGIRHHFKALYGQDNLLAHSKIERGHQLMSDFAISPKDAVFIGDTDHDLEVGHALGIDTLLVAEGHQAYERLIRKHPHVLKEHFLA